MQILESRYQLTLACMLAQNLNNSPALIKGILVPLEVPARVFEHGSKFITLQFIRGEDPSARRVREEDLVHVLADQAHTRLLPTLRGSQLLPIRNDDGASSSMNFLDLTKTFFFVQRDNRENLVDWLSSFGEELGVVIR